MCERVCVCVCVFSLVVLTFLCRFLTFVTPLDAEGAAAVPTGEPLFAAALRVARGRAMFHINLGT